MQAGMPDFTYSLLVMIHLGCMFAMETHHDLFLPQRVWPYQAQGCLESLEAAGNKCAFLQVLQHSYTNKVSNS